MTRLDWDAGGYHRVASVQEAWGIDLLRRIPPQRYRALLDAGCGSGRLTAHLLRRFPGAIVTALDRSGAMLAEAERNLRRFRGRLRLLEADLLDAHPPARFDLIFSNATFHWVRDHAKLFRNLFAWLAPGGRLVAQCGGAGNLRRVEDLTPVLSRRAPFAPRLRDFRRPVYYAGPDETRRRLARAGFHDVDARLHTAPTRFPSRAAFTDFARNVTLVPNLSRLDPAELRDAFVEGFVKLYEERHGRSYLLDYVRLTVLARRPPDARP